LIILSPYPYYLFSATSNWIHYIYLSGQLLPLSYLIRIFFIAGPTYQQGLAILGYKARNIYKDRLLVGVYVVVRLSYSESRCVLVGFFSMYCDSDSNNIHDLFLHVMHYSVISVCVCVCCLAAHLNYILLLRKKIKPLNNEVHKIIYFDRNHTINYFQITVQYFYIIYQRIQWLHEICCYFATLYPLIYQRIYMGCIVPLQHPKTQRIFIRW
jgi:hypothetical protein